MYVSCPDMEVYRKSHLNGKHKRHTYGELLVHGLVMPYFGFAFLCYDSG